MVIIVCVSSSGKTYEIGMLQRVELVEGGRAFYGVRGYRRMPEMVEAISERRCDGSGFCNLR